MTFEEFRKFIPLHCPRFKVNATGYLYEVGKPWEQPFVTVMISETGLSMMGDEGLSEDSMSHYYQVMCRDARCSWLDLADSDPGRSEEYKESAAHWKKVEQRPVIRIKKA